MADRIATRVAAAPVALPTSRRRRRWIAAAAALFLAGSALGWLAGLLREGSSSDDAASTIAALSTRIETLDADVVALRDETRTTKERSDRRERELENLVASTESDAAAARRAARENGADLERERDRTEAAARRHREALERLEEATLSIARLERTITDERREATLVAGQLERDLERERTRAADLERDLATHLASHEADNDAVPETLVAAPPPTRVRGRGKPRVLFTRRPEGWEVDYSGSREEVVAILFDMARDPDPRRADLALSSLENLIGPRVDSAERTAAAESPGVFASLLEGVAGPSRTPRSKTRASTRAERRRDLEERWRALRERTTSETDL